jgi:hypothetical protein
MGELKLLFFALGTLGFFANVYLSIKHPELVKAPQPAMGDAPSDMTAETALDVADDAVDWRKWDKAATWIMWGGWGVAAAITLVDRSGYLDILEL